MVCAIDIGAWQRLINTEASSTLSGIDLALTDQSLSFVGMADAFMLAGRQLRALCGSLAGPQMMLEH